MVSGWTGTLPLPFLAAVEFISAGALSQPVPVDSLLSLLDPCDLDYFEQLIMRQGPRRQREWLIGRIAARRAVDAWRHAQGDGDVGREPEINYDAEGRPVLNRQDANSAALFLSISHKEGLAVAAVADRAVGIDLERFSALRDPAGILQVAFSPAETAILANAGDDDARLVVIAWSAKEAVAKSLGRKLLGRERNFTLSHLDPTNCIIQVTHGGQMIDAYYAVDDDFVCTVAAPAAPHLS